MKYKTKVEVMQDGSSRYYPMVKKHWWSCWKYITNSLKTTLRKPLYFCYSYENAKYIINQFQEDKLDHTYEIPYKEDDNED